MKKKLVITGSLILIFILGMFVSSDFDYFVKSNWKRITNDPAQLCVDYERDNFKSPNSVRLFKSIRSLKEDEQLMYVVVLAKNPMGVEVQSTIKCYLDDGKFNVGLHIARTILNK
ncbi:hypothetical protein [Pragia fontium]|uniref:hypothetical protein n=1 Tax=Pragia fontium TaxID=82985 RepID=UPI0006497D25|nr:hypothetical protein [Pragia fontium]AKJ41558.1 hypothetical protein QQ39_05235 [Pragia fontium]